MADFLARRWKRQPQGPVEIDWSNPLTDGLCGLAIPTAGGLFDVTSNKLVRSTDPAYLNQKPRGDAIGTNPVAGTSYASYQLTAANPAQGTSPWTKPSAQITLSVLCERLGDMPESAPLAGAGSPYTAPYTSFMLDDSTGLGDARFAAAPGGSYREVAVASSLLDSRRMLLSGVYDGEQMRLLKNGIVIGSTDASGAIGYVNSADFGFAVGNFFDLDGFDCRFNGSIFLVGLWTKARPASAERAFVDNPWQLLKPRRSIIYSFPSGGITIPTLSLAGVQDVTDTTAKPKVTLTF